MRYLHSKGTIRRALLITLGVAAAVAAVIVGWGWYRYDSAQLSLAQSPTRIQVARGASARTIGQELERRGVGVPAWFFSIVTRLRGDGDRIRSGVYQFSAPLTLHQLLDRMVRGDVLLKDIRFTEGWTFRQMRATIDQHPELQHDTAALTERQILERIGATEAVAEGLFFPSTYYFSPGSSDIEVYRQAYRQLKRLLDEAWAGRAAGLPYDNAYQMLVMASIVEKETGRESDRDKVAAVFVNRLRRGMLLQSDPTTIYGMGDRFDGNLRKRDLQAATPYNTYTRTGLPPTPIALPGKSSLIAATRPAAIPALYFVARGDGTSEFSDDLAAHNRAVQKYQIIRR